MTQVPFKPSSSLIFQAIISHKGVERGPMPLLNTNRKSHEESPTALLDLTVTLKGYTRLPTPPDPWLLVWPLSDSLYQDSLQHDNFVRRAGFSVV